MIDVATPNDNGSGHSWTIEDLLESISAEPELWVRAVAAWITERSVPFRSCKVDWIPSTGGAIQVSHRASKARSTSYETLTWPSKEQEVVLGGTPNSNGPTRPFPSNEASPFIDLTAAAAALVGVDMTYGRRATSWQPTFRRQDTAGRISGVKVDQSGVTVRQGRYPAVPPAEMTWPRSTRSMAVGCGVAALWWMRSALSVLSCASSCATATRRPATRNVSDPTPKCSGWLSPAIRPRRPPWACPSQWPRPQPPTPCDPRSPPAGSWRTPPGSTSWARTSPSAKLSAWPIRFPVTPAPGWCRSPARAGRILAVLETRRGYGGEAHRHLRVASELARRLGADRNDYGSEFGPTNIALHQVAVEVELGNAAESLQLAGKVRPYGLSAERQARFLVDVARANDQRLGQPTCPACFDYRGAVIRNASVGELWSQPDNRPPAAPGCP